MTPAVDVATFKTYFDRGQFIYGTTPPDIRDKDIEQALGESLAVINQSLYPTQELLDQAYLYLTAHFLMTDTDAQDSGGQARLLQTSRSVDGISESVDIPDWMKQGEFAFYTSTYYGQKWAILTKPYLGGAVFAIEGATQP